MFGKAIHSVSPDTLTDKENLIQVVAKGIK